MTEGLNTEFGLPPVSESSVAETEEQRLERLRKKAAAAVAVETDEALLKRMIAEERAKVAPPSPDGQGFAPIYSKVIVYQGNDKQDQQFVPLGINGFVIKVPRGEEVIIPHCFVTECLERAIEEITVRSQNGYTTRPAHRFQYRVNGPATPEEYQAYLEKQKTKVQRELAQAA